MSAKHITKPVTLTAHEWEVLGAAVAAAAAHAKTKTAQRVLSVVADLAAVAVDEAAS